MRSRKYVQFAKYVTVKTLEWSVVLVWFVPKGLLFDLPRALVKRACGRRTWLKREIFEFPGRLKRLSSVIWNGINKIPHTVGKVLNHVVKGAAKGPGGQSRPCPRLEEGSSVSRPISWKLFPRSSNLPPSSATGSRLCQGKSKLFPGTCGIGSRRWLVPLPE